MSITTRELKKIRKALPDGAYAKISEKTGLGIATVKGALFNPTRFKAEVIEIALTLIKDEKARVEKLKETIKQIA